MGVGWGLGLPDSAPLESVIEACLGVSGGKGGADTIRRLATTVHTGDFMWTRDSLGRYWLCQVTGEWRYDTSEMSVYHDLFNVRPARWLDDWFHDYEVPGSVVRGFVGVGQTLRRASSEPVAERVTELIWKAAISGGNGVPMFTPAEALREIFDPTDIEDLVLLYLQAQGWILLPSTRTRSTPTYEAALRRARDDDTAVVSVKSGASNPVPLDSLREAAGAAHAYAFSTHDRYEGNRQDITIIARSEILNFMAEFPELLPERVARWLTTETT